MAKPRKKKISNPRIAEKPKKKRKTKLEIRRSQAAKKGWQTRRINALAKEKKKAASVAKKKPSKKKTRKQLEKENRELTEKAERLQEELSQKWVHLADDEMLHEDGTLAVMPSTLRHQSFTNSLRNELMQARDVGEVSLASLVRYYAQYLDVPAQELYTLLFSP